MSNAQKIAHVYTHTHTHTINFVNLLRTLPGRCLQWLRSDLCRWRRAALNSKRERFSFRQMMRKSVPLMLDSQSNCSLWEIPADTNIIQARHPRSRLSGILKKRLYQIPQMLHLHRIRMTIANSMLSGAGYISFQVTRILRTALSNGAPSVSEPRKAVAA